MNGEAKLGEQRSGDCRIIRPYSNWCVDTLRQYPNKTGVKIVRLEEGYIKKHCPHQANEILEWKTGALEQSLSGTEQLSELFNNAQQNPEEKWTVVLTKRQPSYLVQEDKSYCNTILEKHNVGRR